MNVLSCIVSFTMAISGLASIEPPAADITGTWEVTIHYLPPDGDYRAAYVLKQDGEKITGTFLLESREPRLVTRVGRGPECRGRPRLPGVCPG